MSDVTIAGVQVLALIACLGGVISWLFKLSYGEMKADRDWWRKAYEEKEKTEWQQLQVMNESMVAMRLLLEKRRSG